VENNEHTEEETHEQCKKSSKDIIIPFSGTEGCTNVVPGFSSGCFITLVKVKVKFISIAP